MEEQKRSGDSLSGERSPHSMYASIAIIATLALSTTLGGTVADLQSAVLQTSPEPEHARTLLILHGWRDHGDFAHSFKDFVEGRFAAFYDDVLRVGYYGDECALEADATAEGPTPAFEKDTAASPHNRAYGGSAHPLGRFDHDEATVCTAGNPAAAVAVDLTTRGIVHNQADVDFRHLAYHVAWFIYNHYSVQGKTVDVAAHSLGGLVIRYALAVVELRNQGPPIPVGATDAGATLTLDTGDPNVNEWPPVLYVEDVVTWGTPHGGLDFLRCLIAGLGGYSGGQMCSGSPAMQWLSRNGQNPQGQGDGGTEWSLIGSRTDGVLVSCDQAVPGPIAVGMTAKVRYIYLEPCYGHLEYYKDLAIGNDAVYSRSIAMAAGQQQQGFHAALQTAQALLQENT